MNIEFSKTIDINGRELLVDVQAEAHVFGENYGEDADGNRGEWRIFVDDLEITILDGHGKDITEKVRTKYKASFESIEEDATERLTDAYNEGPDYEPE